MGVMTQSFEMQSLSTSPKISLIILSNHAKPAKKLSLA